MIAIFVLILYETEKMLYNKRYSNLGGMAMNCMKCGRETQEDNVFCQACLLEMQKYPVHADTVVLLPRRKDAPVVKKAPKRHVPTQEEQLKLYRKRVFILTVLLAVSIGVIALMLKPTMHYIRDEHFEIGQNYSTVIPATSGSATKSGE